MRRKLVFNINDQQKEIIRMIYVLSNKHSYILYDQLIRFLIRFNVYQKESTIRMSMKKLVDDKLVLLENTDRKYKIVVLTYRGLEAIGIEQKRKPDPGHEYTLEYVSRRIEYIYNISLTSEAETFDDFLNDMDLQWSTLFIEQSPKKCIEYNERLEQRYNTEGKVLGPTTRQIVNNLYHHKLRLIYEKEKLMKNLKNTAVKTDKTSTSNLYYLLRKNIYMDRMKIVGRDKDNKKNYRNTYVKFTATDVLYTAKYIVDDISYLYEVHNILYSPDVDFEYIIIAKNKEDVEITLNQISEIESLDPKKIKKGNKDIYKKCKDKIRIEVIDMDKFFEK